MRRRQQRQDRGIDEPDKSALQECRDRMGRHTEERGSVVDPIRNWSIEAAHCRPSRIAHTTSDWPRRMSPAENTFGSEVW